MGFQPPVTRSLERGFLLRVPDRIVSHVKSDRRMLSDEAIQKVDSAIYRNNHHAPKELNDNIFSISCKDTATALSAWFRKQQPHQS
jgi:hypothetical protein